MNADPNEFLALLSQFLPSIPLFVVWIGAGVYALATWRRHPMVSLLTLAAVVMQTAGAVAGTFGSWYLLRSRADLGLSSADIGLRLAILGFGRSGLAALAYVLLFVALFGWRASPAKRFPPPPNEEALPRDNPDDDRIRR